MIGRDKAVSDEILILVHLESLKHVGPVEAKTANGISQALGLSPVAIYRALRPMRFDSLIISSQERIEGKYPARSGHHPPLIYNITEEGVIKLAEVRGMLGGAKA